MIRASFAALCLFAAGSTAWPQEPFQLQPGEHVCIIGNTTAERMQHDGWLEVMLHQKFPKHQLVVRNLGYSADELTVKLRSMDFGSQDEWLTRCKADVIFAFFGFNESFKGAEGLAKFKSDLDAFIAHTAKQKYNGKSAPRLVLFTPLAYQGGNPNWPAKEKLNEQIAPYSQAMLEVARSHGTTVVNTFSLTEAVYSDDPKPYTINGYHLNDEGGRMAAEFVMKQLFGDAGNPANWTMVRAAVLDKNFHWFNRYRTVDGYSIFGGRADLKFVKGQTNREVAQREMEILDQMTANRDKVIWAAAEGKEIKPDDSNTSPFIPVVTNKPGPLPGGKHAFNDPDQESISKMTVHKNMKVNLFASEKEFPELAKPVQMAFDPKGRLFVAVMPSYPHWKPKEKMDDKVLCLEDTNADGKADKCTVFADGLHVPTGLEFWNGGLFVGGQPDMLFLKDTDGDGKADQRTRVLHGLDSADTHHAMNSFTLGPGGALYFQEGTFHHTQVETLYGPVRNANAGCYRYDPRTERFEVYVNYGFANPHGHVFDRWGQDFITDGTTNQNWFAAAFSGRLDHPAKHPPMRTYFQQRVRPCGGTEILSSEHFPPEFQGNLLNANVIGFQGILQYKYKEEGSGFTAEEQEPILFSSDPNFRPVDIEIGPDGAIYFVDWQNPIIGHMQHNLRDPSRDTVHGRVYRVTYEGRPLLKSVDMTKLSVTDLILKTMSPNDRERSRAKIELSGKTGEDAKAALATAIHHAMSFEGRNEPEGEHHRLESLWVCQHFNEVPNTLMEQLLSSQDHRARAATVRFLSQMKHKIPNAMELLKKSAADAHPRVRLESIRAASFFDEPEAMEIVAIASDYPTDYYIEYCKTETLKRLEPMLKKALAANKPINVTTDAGARMLLANLDSAALLKRDRSRAVCLELLTRHGFRDEERSEGVKGLAKLEMKSEAAALMEAIQSYDKRVANRDESVLFDLVRLLVKRGAAELVPVRSGLTELALKGASDVSRQLGYIALIGADGNADEAWKLANSSASALRDFVNAIPTMPDPSIRASLYAKIEPLLNGYPEGLKSATAKGVVGRYVRIELPGRNKTLTLAEVEVMSGGKNVARQGKASQKSTSHDGWAQRGIDGKKSGRYSDGGQTHSAEATNDPWWEVDLGKEVHIDAVHVYNRTEQRFGERLANFTLKVLDANRGASFEMDENPTPKPKLSFEFANLGPESQLRRAAMIALVSVRGKETETFKKLADLFAKGTDREGALQALQRIPANHWPSEATGPLLDGVMNYLKSLPVAERTSPAALEAMQMGYAVASLRSGDEASRIRKSLGEIGVRVIRVGTVPDQMIFDQDRIVVQAGRPVEFLFENTDLMPHNFVITKPGALAEIGNLAEAQATQAGALERHYVPQSDKVLLGSRLLQPRQKQRLAFKAPDQPGIYPYVCTYPGHWRRMYGALYVVADLDAYLAGPESYLAETKLTAADELLKNNRPRKEWKLEDFAGDLEKTGSGRSFGNGKQMFAAANCIACHKLGGVGNQFGPELHKLAADRLTPKEILLSMIDPSAKIEDKFVTVQFPMEAGNVVTGMVVEENPDVVKVIENPLASAKPIELKRGEILGRKKSKVSIMPKGLLDKMTKEEILDLVAYVMAAGDAKHKVYSQGHAHGAGAGSAGH
jgi:putative heme-binding domain-containing protein